MMLNFLDKLGDWNPQLLREIKGRIKVFPVIIAFATSLMGQLILFLYQLRDIPDDRYAIYGTYCKLRLIYEQQQKQLQSQLQEQSVELQNLFFYYTKPDNYDPVKVQELKGKIENIQTSQRSISDISLNKFCPIDQIDMSLWWRDHWEYIFLSLSVIFIFTLLVAGTFLLINNLVQEERHGTLNFLRLSPQEESSILTGKLLGVPILIYLIILTAIPLHLWAGHAAKISLSYIFSFYIILGASCIFFYSAALLFTLVCHGGFSGFRPWVGTGAVLFLLMITMGLSSSSTYSNDPTAWLRIFSPFDMTNYLFPNLFRVYNGLPLKGFEFFNLPIGENVFGLVTFHVLNYGLWSYWNWQALKRCFRNPNATILSKRQSYFIVAAFELIVLGFIISDSRNSAYQIFQDIGMLYLLNLVVFVGLMTILSPHRQTIQDWARYQYHTVSGSKSVWKKSLWADLMWGEKSPAILAIAINLCIATAAFIVVIVFGSSNNVSNFNQIQALMGVALSISLIMIYATITQIMLLLKTAKRSVWAIGTVSAAMFLPLMILSVLKIEVSNHQNILWLLSSYPWYGVENSAITTIFMACIAEFSVLALLLFHLTRQVRLAGESATKALLAER